MSEIKAILLKKNYAFCKKTLEIEDDVNQSRTHCTSLKLQLRLFYMLFTKCELIGYPGISGQSCKQGLNPPWGK